MERITFPSGRTTRGLLAILGVLVALHLGVAFCHVGLHWRLEALTRLTDLDIEANLPTFFNAALFFIVAAFAYLYGRTDVGKQRRGWFLMAATFVFLGLDEGSQIHEQFITFGQEMLARSPMEGEARGWLSFAWVVPYAIGTGVLAIILWRWFMHLAPALRTGLLISGVVYVFGALVLEMAGAKYIATQPARDAALFPWLPCEVYGEPAGCWLFADPRYIALYTLSEVGEMAGLILCIHALLRGFEAKGIVPALGLDAKS